MSLIDLKKIRESTRLRTEDGRFRAMTKAQLAKEIGALLKKEVFETQLARYESDSSNIPFELLRIWLLCLGTSIQEQLELLESKQGVLIGRPYDQFFRRVDLLNEYLEEGMGKLELDKFPLVDSIHELCIKLYRKPNVVLLGSYSAGKTTLASYLLGEISLPTWDHRLDSAIRVFCHVEDKPLGLIETRVSLDAEFNLGKLGDLAHIKNHRVVTDGSNMPCPGYDLVYVDSPVLLGCNIIDTPGLQYDLADNNGAYRTFAYMDVLVFASQISGFLSGPEMAVLRLALERLPFYGHGEPGVSPLLNAFIVATHASNAMDSDGLDSQLDEAAKRIFREVYETVPAGCSQALGEMLDEQLLRQRIFAFWKESPEINAPFIRALSWCLSDFLPGIFKSSASNSVKSWLEAANTSTKLDMRRSMARLQQADGAANGKSKVSEESEKVDRHIEEVRGDLIRRVADSRCEAQRVVAEFFDIVVGYESILRIIESRYPGNSPLERRDAQYNITSYVCDLFQRNLSKIMQEELQYFQNLYKKLACEVDGLSGEIPRMPSENFDRILQRATILPLFGFGVSISARYIGKSIFGEDWRSRLAKQVSSNLSSTSLRDLVSKNVDEIFKEILELYMCNIDDLSSICAITKNEIIKLNSENNELPELESYISDLQHVQDFINRMPLIGIL
jgi:transcriptional regulator with XRE-family HTH domain